MKIYTKTGDEGETGLFAGPRVWKDDLRIEAYGVVDELNAFLGWGRAQSLAPEIDAVLDQVQHDLFAVGAELATPEPQLHGTDLVGHEHIVARRDPSATPARRL
jgi:cob(I)alamin adenosyltransferase